MGVNVLETAEITREKFNIHSIDELNYPKFTLAKNKARFLRMLSWYKGKHE
jgi:hypothetical protein